MYRISKWVKEFFSISHSQANGIVILLPVVAAILVSEPLWGWYISRTPPDLTADQRLLDSVVREWKLTGTVLSQNTQAAATSPAVLSVFNPNRAVREKLIELGFPGTLADRVIRYREKGGQFRTRSDLLKLYGMDSVLYRRLYGYIDLPTTSKKLWPPRQDKSPVRYQSRRPEVASFDINTADTTHLMAIRGIGSKLSVRIMRYRDALGGFISLNQLREVYGLDSLVVDRLATKSFITPSFTPKKINVNTATEVILQDHPYFSRSEARAIVSYRFQHGGFKTVEDLDKLSSMRKGTIQRIMPYLTISDP